MEYNFEKFKGRNVRLENRITITKSNSIGFPQKFYKDNKIKDFQFAVLYWDNSNKAIGIYFTNDEDEKNKFSIMHSKIGYGGSITARSFLKTYNIDLEKHHGRYEWDKVKIDEDKEIFVIKLDKEKFDK